MDRCEGDRVALSVPARGERAPHQEPCADESCEDAGEITSTVISAYAALAVVASLLAIPLGVGLYLALFGVAGDTTEDAVIAPWWSLALVPIGAVLVVVTATSLPARLATRIHTADALRYE